MLILATALPEILCAFVRLFCTTRNNVVSASTGKRGRSGWTTTSSLMPLRFSKPSAYQCTADASPHSSSSGGCKMYDSVRISSPIWLTMRRLSLIDSCASGLCSSASRASRSRHIDSTAIFCPVTSCKSRAMRRRSSSCNCNSRADNCRSEVSVTRKASLASTISVSSVATAQMASSPNSLFGLIVSRIVRGLPSLLARRISPRVLASLAPKIKVFRNSASLPETKLCSGAPINLSSGTPKNAAKLLFEYRTVPSSPSVAAPSSIVSTSNRYGCSAPCSVNTWSPLTLDTNTASTSPMCIARSVSSSSATRALSSFAEVVGNLVSFFCLFNVTPLRESQIQPQYHSILIREISHQPAQRQRQPLNQGRCSDDLILRSHRGLLINVD